MSHKSRSPVEQQGLATSSQANVLGQGQQQAGASGIEQTLADPTSTPLYKALYSTGQQQLSDAYQGAAANTAERAQQAGFGYSQPVAQGAQDQLAAQEASAAGQLGAKAIAQSVPEELAGYGQLGRPAVGHCFTEIGGCQDGEGRGGAHAQRSRCSQQRIDHHRHEDRVQTNLYRQTRDGGERHRLGNDHRGRYQSRSDIRA